MISRTLRLRLGLLGALIALGGAATAVGSSGNVSFDCHPLAAARAKAAAQHPGVVLPTRLPPIAFVCPGAGRTQDYIFPFVYNATFTKGKPVKVQGYVGCNCLSGIERTAFGAQFWVWRGHRSAGVLDFLAGHVAKPFTAGRYKGTIAIPVPSVADYVWEAGQYTYLFSWNTAPGPPGFTPLTVIASFTAP